jgi:hypothetical protein
MNSAAGPGRADIDRALGEIVSAGGDAAMKVVKAKIPNWV